MADRGTRLSCSSCRSSPLAFPYIVLPPPSPSTVLPLVATVCSFDSFQSLHRHCHCPALALASKVTPGILVEKFGYLISYRGLPTLSPASFFPSREASRSRYSFHIPLPRHVTHATRPSTFPRGDGGYDRYFLPSSLLFVAGITSSPPPLSGGEICRARYSRRAAEILKILSRM